MARLSKEGDAAVLKREMPDEELAEDVRFTLELISELWITLKGVSLQRDSTVLWTTYQQTVYYR